MKAEKFYTYREMLQHLTEHPFDGFVFPLVEGVVVERKMCPVPLPLHEHEELVQIKDGDVGVREDVEKELRVVTASEDKVEKFFLPDCMADIPWFSLVTS